MNIKGVTLEFSDGFKMQSPPEDSFGRLNPLYRNFTRQMTATESVLGKGYDPVKAQGAIWSSEVEIPFCGQCGQPECECKWADGGSPDPLPTSRATVL